MSDQKFISNSFDNNHRLHVITTTTKNGRIIHRVDEVYEMDDDRQYTILVETNTLIDNR